MNPDPFTQIPLLRANSHSFFKFLLKCLSSGSLPGLPQKEEQFGLLLCVCLQPRADSFESTAGTEFLEARCLLSLSGLHTPSGQTLGFLLAGSHPWQHQLRLLPWDLGSPQISCGVTSNWQSSSLCLRSDSQEKLAGQKPLPRAGGPG